MYKKIENYFTSLGIEYFAALRYSDCREINPSLKERMGFEPRTVIIYLVPYYTGETVNISRYAASLDYHIVLREISQGLIEHLQSEHPEASFRGYGDHSPIDEVGAALSASLGVVGDNGLILNEKYGSYVFIGDVICDLDPSLLGTVDPAEPQGCIHCGACKLACPTGILSGEGGDCLSAITQRKGELTEDELALMRKYNTVWGCDECQRCCPYNNEPTLTTVEFFYRDRIPELTRELLDGMSREEFEKRAFAWRGRRTVERNLNLVYQDKK